MPKEVAHWVIARRVMDRLPPGSLADAVRDHPNCLDLGAVFHDVGYYGQGREAGNLEALADRLHGAAGEDTNEILRRLAPDPAESAAKPWLAAFLVGLVTHMVADRKLHPLVYYFTGNYYEEDTRKQQLAATAHRRLEALMDLRLTGGLQGVRRFSLRRIARELEVPLDDLLEEVAGRLSSRESPVSSPGLVQAVGFFSKIQWLACRPWLVKILGQPLRLRPADRSNLYSLTYFSHLESATKRLASTLDYLNPYSGEPCQQTLEGAVEAIVDSSVAFCSDLPTALSAMGPGESLEMGLPSVVTAHARHFHPLVLAQEYREIDDFAMLPLPE